MPRLVQKSATAPIKVGDKHICMCGLAENQPFCDTSHTQTEAEDPEKLYWYAGGVAEEIVTEASECSGHCGEGGCGNC